MVSLEENIDTVGFFMQRELNRLGVKVEYGEKDKGKNTLYDMARSMKLINNGTKIILKDAHSFSVQNLIFGKDGGYISLRVIILMIIFQQVKWGVKFIFMIIFNLSEWFQLLVW